MIEKKYLDTLIENVLNFDFEGVKKTAKEAIKAGVHPVKAITEGLAAGLKIVGEKFENRECFLSELVLAAEVMKEGMSIIQPYIKGEELKTKGRAVLATVRGDNHDIGKSLVATLLRISGFDVCAAEAKEMLSDKKVIREVLEALLWGKGRDGVVEYLLFSNAKKGQYCVRRGRRRRS